MHAPNQSVHPASSPARAASFTTIARMSALGIVMLSGLWTGRGMAAPVPGVGAVRLVTRDADAPVTLARYYYKHHHGTAAAATPAAKPAAASAKPALVGTYGDWGVYVSQGAKSKICYALGQPSARQPASIKKDGAYVFISNRPGEGVHNEVSIMAGLPLKEGATGAKAEIGSTSYELVAKGQNAFLKNAAEEGQFVGTLKRRGAKLTLVLPSGRSSVVDTYSLAGMQQALDRVAKECP